MKHGVPMSAKTRTIAIKGGTRRYVFHVVFLGSNCISLNMALYGDGRYFRRHWKMQPTIDSAAFISESTANT